jgi:formate hydrogenlyase subunit 3/multisubunit Na+/H+ antiporter MnhD subunit
MLIFYYVALGIVAAGAVVGAVGLGYAVSYAVAIRSPPRSEEDEQRRRHVGTLAASLVTIGVLLCGVGVLFM